MPAAELTVTSPRTGTTFAAVATVISSRQETFGLTVTVTMPGKKAVYCRANVGRGFVSVVSITAMSNQGNGHYEEVEVNAGAVRDMISAGIGYMWSKMEDAAVASNAVGRAAFRASLDAA